jgi:hypothetical protein
MRLLVQWAMGLTAHTCSSGNGSRKQVSSFSEQTRGRGRIQGGNIGVRNSPAQVMPIAEKWLDGRVMAAGQNHAIQTFPASKKFLEWR